MTARHQSFSKVEVGYEDCTVRLQVNIFDLAASLEVASMQADRDQMPRIAERLRNDSDLLRLLSQGQIGPTTLTVHVAASTADHLSGLSEV